jgi:hypothetical protein
MTSDAQARVWQLATATPYAAAKHMLFCLPGTSPSRQFNYNMTILARLPGLCHLDRFINTLQFLPVYGTGKKIKKVFAIPPRQITNDEIMPAHLPGLVLTTPLAADDNKHIIFLTTRTKM